mgnify:CR=1 FL=1
MRRQIIAGNWKMHGSRASNRALLDALLKDLGALKGNKGNQNYRIPNDVDPEQFKSAVIWCRRFTVGFGVAPLTW